jgi:hypothetical protein
MIIQISKDSTVLGTSHLLEHTHPTERVQSNTLSLIDPDSEKVLQEADGRPIERISIISHTSFVKYGGMKPEELAAKLIKSLQEADAVTPETSKHITHIDLIGCHNGYVSPEGESMSLTVAKHLLAAGYNIQISSTTNMSHPEPQPVYKLFFQSYDSFDDVKRHGVSNLIFRSAEAAKSFTFCTEKIDQIHHEIDDLKFNLAENKEKLNACRSNYFDLEARGVAKDDAQYTPLVEEATVLRQDISRIHSKIKELEQAVERVSTRMQDYTTPVVRIPNIRQYLDSDPQCHFTTRARHDLAEKKGLKHPLYQAASTNDVTALIAHIAEDPSKINLPNPHGITPLFIAAFKGNIDSARTLLEHGANDHLAPTFHVKDLYENLSADERITARELIAKKCLGEVTDATIVQLSPLEIAQIKGHHDLTRLLAPVPVQERTSVSAARPSAIEFIERAREGLRQMRTEAISESKAAEREAVAQERVPISAARPSAIEIIGRAKEDLARMRAEVWGETEEPTDGKEVKITPDL